MAPDRNSIRGDSIHIRDLRLHCIIGINPDERDRKQEVVVNLTLFTDLEKAGASDSIADTVSYRQVEDDLVELIESSSYFLIERLAEVIARKCLEYPRIDAVSVRIDKPGALRFARSAGVEITRRKGETKPSSTHPEGKT